jgi:hypothetical protein
MKAIKIEARRDKFGWFEKLANSGVSDIIELT